MSLLDKSKVLERAKILALDKANLLKTALKDASSQAYDLIKSKFAQKLPTGGYLCLACKVKCPDHISALKHFGSQEHRAQLDSLKSKVGQLVAESSSVRNPTVELPADETVPEPQLIQLVVEEELVEDEDGEEFDRRQQDLNQF